MGAGNLKALAKEHNIVALCDVNQITLDKEAEKYPEAKKFQDYRRMFEQMADKIDGVVIATPDHSHAAITMDAMKLGKSVYTQKPLTYTVGEARVLTEYAREHNIITQMGNQGRSAEGIRLTTEWIHDGAIGKIREVHAWTDRCWRKWFYGNQGERPEEIQPIPETLQWDLWLGPAPERPFHSTYLDGKWRAWWDFGTGALGDMGCHILDPVFLALNLGAPESVNASGTVDAKEQFPFGAIIHYNFPARGDMPPVKLHWYEGGLKPERPADLETGRKLADNGVIFVGETGNLMCGCYGSSPRIFPEKLMKAYKLPEKTLPRVDCPHEIEWARAIKSGQQPCSSFEYSGPLTEMVLLGVLAMRHDDEIIWDSKNLKATNAPQLDKYINREYRPGWSL